MALNRIGLGGKKIRAGNRKSPKGKKDDWGIGKVQRVKRDK